MGIVRQAVLIKSKGEIDLPLFTPREAGAKYIDLAKLAGLRLKTLHDAFWMFHGQDQPRPVNDFMQMKQNQVLLSPP